MRGNVDARREMNTSSISVVVDQSYLALASAFVTWIAD